MAELFTVKLDLSDVLQDSSEPEVYILMVDTRNTKMIYEFKMWVRFLFSLDVSIQLVYDDAVIHDLENVKILSLLKSIQVKPIGSQDGEQQQQKLIEQLQKYNEWCKYSYQLKSPEANDPISVSDCCNLVQITDGVQDCSPGKINHFPVSGNNIKLSNNEASESHENNRCLTPKNKVTEIDGCKTKTVVKDKSISNIFYKRRPVQKPFSVGDVLKLIRTKEVQSDKEDKVARSPENVNFNTPSREGLEGVNECYDGELERSFEKKQRKRLRKHKSKKKGSVCDINKPPFNAHNSFNSFSNDGVSKLLEKPKHIRFDFNKDDMEYEVSCNDPTTEQEIVLNGLSDENKKINLSLQQLKDIVEEKKRSIANCLNEDDNEKVNLSLNECQEWRFPQTVGMNNSDENNLKMLDTDHGKKAEDFNVLHALQCLRDQNDKPLVFKRFD